MTVTFISIDDVPAYEVEVPPGEAVDEFSESLEEALGKEQPDDLEGFLIERGLSFRPAGQMVS